MGASAGDDPPRALPVEFREVCYEASGTKILNRLSFRVEAGETLVLLGRSGSGKTTALRLINGLLQATSGVVTIGEKNVHDWDLIDLRRKTGYVIQESGLFPHFTVERNVGLVPSLLKWPADRIWHELNSFSTRSACMRMSSGGVIRGNSRGASGNASAWPAPWQQVAG